jgi:hypothetical protein
LEVATLSNEHAFWERILEQLNPQWSIALPKSEPGAAPDLAELSVHIYVIDTANGWTLMGSTREVDAQAARLQTTQTPQLADLLVGSLGRHLAECSDAGMDETWSQAPRTISASLCAISYSQSFEQVQRARGRVNGHWLYLLYRLADGDVLARPGFIGPTGPNLLQAQDLVRAVRQVVQMDLTAPASSHIAQEIRSSGGVRLAQEFGGR